MRLPLAREAAHAVEMVAQRHDRRLLHHLALNRLGLAETDAGKQAIAETAPLIGVAFQPTVFNKVFDGAGGAALKERAFALRVWLVEAALLQHADVADAPSAGVDIVVGGGVLELHDLEGKAGRRKNSRLFK